VNRSEIQNDDEYFDILDDVREECSQHGRVINVLIPRTKDGHPSAAEGSVFVEFADIESAKKAANSLKGRKFADQIVIVNYVSSRPPLYFPHFDIQYDEIRFSNRVLV
jgi:splicing factor U2AF subunit